MSHETEQHETHTSGPFAWAAFLLAPFILLRMMCACVAATAGHFRASRKAIAARRANDWRALVDDLVENEFMVFDFTVSGARMLLATGALDVLAIEPTLDRSRFHAPPPRSARELTLRIETVCRILSAPEAHIRRMASRMLSAAKAAARLDGAFPHPLRSLARYAMRALFAPNSDPHAITRATGPPRRPLRAP